MNIEVFEKKFGKDLPKEKSNGPSEPARKEWDFDDAGQNKNMAL